MRRKINLLLAFAMIATQLFACGSPQADGKNSSASGETDRFYMEQAVESWYRYEEEDGLPVRAEEVRLNGVTASAWPVSVVGGETVEFRVTVPASAGYFIVAEYHPVGDILATDALYEIRLNGGEAIEAQLPILWHDSVRGATDRSGNESTRKQESLLDTVINPFLSYSDISRQTAIWNLEKGETYTFSITPEEQGLELSGLMLCRMEENSTGG